MVSKEKELPTFKLTLKFNSKSVCKEVLEAKDETDLKKQIEKDSFWSKHKLRTKITILDPK